MEQQLLLLISSTLQKLVEESHWQLPINLLIMGVIDRRTHIFRRGVSAGEDGDPDWSYQAIASYLLQGGILELEPPISVTFTTDGGMVVAIIDEKGTEPRFVTPNNLDS